MDGNNPADNRKKKDNVPSKNAAIAYPLLGDVICEIRDINVLNTEKYSLDMYL